MTGVRREGETLLGSDLHVFAGGKGANQAAAAARAGAQTRFLGCVGDDSNGAFLRARLGEAGVLLDDLRSGGAVHRHGVDPAHPGW